MLGDTAVRVLDSNSALSIWLLMEGTQGNWGKKHLFILINVMMLPTRSEIWRKNIGLLLNITDRCCRLMLITKRVLLRNVKNNTVWENAKFSSTQKMTLFKWWSLEMETLAFLRVCSWCTKIQYSAVQCNIKYIKAYTWAGNAVLEKED